MSDPFGPQTPPLHTPARPPPLPATPLEYSSPSATARRRWTSVPQTLYLALSVMVLSGIMIFVVPRIEDVLRDFNIALPWPTKVVLEFSRWFNNGYGWVVVWLIPFVVPIITTALLPDSRDPAHRGSRRLAMFVLGLIVMAAFTLVILGLALPMANIIEAVNNPPQKK